MSYAFSADDPITVKFGVFDATPLISIEENGKGSGVFSDFLEAVAEEEGWKIEYVPGTFAECMDWGKSGEVDLIGSIMQIKEREGFLDFNEKSIMNIWGQVYVGVDSKVSMIFDLSGKKVGIMKAGAHGANFVKLTETFDIECRIIEYNDFDEITDAIHSGRIDAGVYASFHGHKYEHEGTLKQTSIIFNPTKLKFATAKGKNQDLLKAIDKHFSKWEADSSSQYYKILDKWFHVHSSEAMPRWLKHTVYVSGIIFLASIVFIILLRRQVKVRTEALLESREQHKRIVDSLIDTFLYRHDSKGVLTYVSSSVAEVLGYPADELKNKYTKYLTDDPINQDAISSKNEAIKGNRQPGYEMQVYHKDGSIRWLQVSETPVFDKNGKVIAVEGVAHNVTDRKAWEEALRQLTETTSGQLDKSFFDIVCRQLSKALKANHVFIGELCGEENNFISTISVIADGEISNNFSYDLMGTPCENVLEKEICSFSSGVAEEFPRDALLTAMNIEGYVGIPLLDSQGKSIGILAALFRSPLVNAEFAESILKVFSARIESELERMHTEQELISREQQLKSSNEQLKANEKVRESLLRTLEFKNREMQDIVYTASHDLKSPLVNIHGFSGHLASNCQELQWLISSLDEASNIERISEIIAEEIPESLGFITSSVEKMKSLIDGLLRISRIGTTEINIEKIDANSLLDEVRSAMEFQLQAYTDDFRIGKLPCCRGDAKLLNQVFSNLIDNAIKYRHAQRDTIIEVSGHVEGNEVVYCVKDNGMGVGKEYHEKVFQIFHQLNPNEDAGGEGLGLTIVTRILDRLGGRIWLESEAGKGCEFYVSLPKG